MRIILTLLSFFFLLSGCNQKKVIEHPPFSDQEVLDRGDVAIVYGKINNLQVYPHVNEVTLTLPDFSKTGEIHSYAVHCKNEYNRIKKLE